MPELNRRSVLAGAAATAGVALGTPRAAARPRIRVQVTREEHRVVIIGAGFGGGVAALRFAEAGVPSLLLERGIRWPTGPNSDTFPRPSVNPADKRIFWLGSPVQIPLLGISVPPLGTYTGLLERVSGDGMDIICAAGVGGGSLVYQGMTLQPTAEVFNANLPEQLDYTRMDQEYYPRVARMLRLQTAPDELINSKTYRPSRIFGTNVQSAGYALEKVPMPIDWAYAMRELNGEMKPSYTNGDCAFGVNNGGKNSVDVTYIAAAEKTGLVNVATLHNVTDVAKANDGRWEVSVDRIDTSGKVLEKKILTTRALVMAAGQANTTRLLMRAAAKGDIPDMPDGLGTEWGSNGDRIYGWTSVEDNFGAPQGGPVVYCSKDWADPATANTVIQASLPPTPNLRSTMIVGYGVSQGRGRFIYDSGKDDAILQWSSGADDVLYRRIHERVENIAGKGSALTDTTAAYPSTWHPLGGAPMGKVCDLAGRVLGHRGLYVLDGALMPGNSAACNPSMTIAAVAERATDELIAHDVGSVF